MKYRLYIIVTSLIFKSFLYGQNVDKGKIEVTKILDRIWFSDKDGVAFFENKTAKQDFYLIRSNCSFLFVDTTYKSKFTSILFFENYSLFLNMLKQKKKEEIIKVNIDVPYISPDSLIMNISLSSGNYKTFRKKSFFKLKKRLLDNMGRATVVMYYDTRENRWDITNVKKIR